MVDLHPHLHGREKAGSRMIIMIVIVVNIGMVDSTVL
jgi:hypothetical protein